LRRFNKENNEIDNVQSFFTYYSRRGEPTRH
jgi:hypothetical protein